MWEIVLARDVCSWTIDSLMGQPLSMRSSTLEGFVSVKTLNLPPIAAIRRTKEDPPLPRASTLYKRWLDLIGIIFSASKHSPRAMMISSDFWAGYPCLPSRISFSSRVSLIENPPRISVSQFRPDLFEDALSPPTPLQTSRNRASLPQTHRVSPGE